MFFVAGITGHVGGATARHLLQGGHKIRTISRDPAKAEAWRKQGVELVPGDLNDSQTLAKALRGVEGAYLMLPPLLAPSPDFAEAKATIASFQKALRQEQPPRLVVLSSIGSEQDSKLGLITTTHLLEQGLKDLPVPIAFIRAAAFFENLLYALKFAPNTGSLDTFLTPESRKFPMIATEDIGALAAKLLAEGWQGEKKVVELGSEYSPDDIASALGAALNRPVKARSIPREQWTQTLESMGMPEGSTAAFEEMEDQFNSGWIRFGVKGTEAVPATTTPTEFFQKAVASQ